ncbi:MAG: UDP-N-acetylglucosamine 1-carboxyvinyltransferase [Clostridia bacterium]|nr:UDP-N-acetylglucosamine 1-carboxyvinyltransferase [Clostridia bacterium]
MDKIVISGQKPLYGTVRMASMKNAALPIIFATVLVADRCVIKDLPDVSDINLSLEILTYMGAVCERNGRETIIDTSGIRPDCDIPLDLVNKMRASYYLVGAMLGRYCHAHVGYPGGCDFGTRPIDQHLKGFTALGATAGVKGGYIDADAPHGLYGAHIFFDVVSVGATVNAILAATCAEGLTVIERPSREPHIIALANFLNACGANIMGAGTDSIKIRGVKALHGTPDGEMIPDMIEAGTFMAAVAATGGKVKIENVIPKHVESITAKLIEMGATVEIDEDNETVTVERDPEKPLSRVMVKAVPYPGFPTDMQPQICALTCFAQGTSYVSEGVWDNRFRYVEELIRMGAHIMVEGKTAIIEGANPMRGTLVTAVDLRGGAAVVIAGLAAEGITVIDNIKLIQRGYDDIVGKLKNLGAEIRLVSFPD